MAAAACLTACCGAAAAPRLILACHAATLRPDAPALPSLCLLSAGYRDTQRDDEPPEHGPQPACPFSSGVTDATISPSRRLANPLLQGWSRSSRWLCVAEQH
jgi:hypothetical protein